MDQLTQVYHLETLFDLVQTNQILEDGKTFVDAIPLQPLEKIKAAFESAQSKKGFSLKAFITEHFQLPTPIGHEFESKKGLSLEAHLAELWPVLTREPDLESSSLIPLPKQYIVPGGRFREVYYWDSYFTMLGLAIQNRVDLIENMVANFAFLIQTIGHIPNGNRQYYVSRSQPPFFALMVELLSQVKNDASILVDYLPMLEKEYQFWQKGLTNLEKGMAKEHLVCLQDGAFLNRYFDQENIPRQESHAEDKHIAAHGNRTKEIIYKDLRAGAESGWDFSTRWFENGEDISSIETTNIIPVDLNCLLWKMEDSLSKWHKLAGHQELSLQYGQWADQRKKAILDYCWDPIVGFFCDYHFVKQCSTAKITAAGLFPLFMGIASSAQALSCSIITETHLLKAGGLVTTPNFSGQQWDAPNGWAPLQWIAFKGLTQYGFSNLANLIARRWLNLNERTFEDTGKMMEKYNVVDLGKLAGGGEYPGQDGFGWTNGVYLALKKEMENC